MAIGLPQSPLNSFAGYCMVDHPIEPLSHSLLPYFRGDDPFEDYPMGTRSLSPTMEQFSGDYHDPMGLGINEQWRSACYDPMETLAALDPNAAAEVPDYPSIEVSNVPPSGAREYKTWTLTEDKKFEKMLANHVGASRHRWVEMAAQMGRNAAELEHRWQALKKDVAIIESIKEEEDCHAVEGETTENNAQEGQKKKRRDKAVGWSSDEHKLFLVAVKVGGSGDWRSISRKFVKTRSSTQIASHAQKYQMRKKQVAAARGKKKRASIHDQELQVGDFNKLVEKHEYLKDLVDDWENADMRLTQLSIEEINAFVKGLEKEDGSDRPA